MTIIGKQIDVLDHGFIRVIDTMGDDGAVVQAARVSYGKGTKTVNEDAGLINYLVRHYHSTPFEMATIKLHIKLPIFVARQWMRHRTGSFNEVSARYSEVQECFYLPDIENIKSQSGTNKQGSGEPLETEHAKSIRNKFCVLGYDSHQDYKNFLAHSTYADSQLEHSFPIHNSKSRQGPVSGENLMHITLSFKWRAAYIHSQDDRLADSSCPSHLIQLPAGNSEWVRKTVWTATFFMTMTIDATWE